MEMLGGVLVLRRIAASDVSAGKAQAQVDPVIPHLQAFLASPGVRVDVMNLIQVGTFRHIRSSPLVDIRNLQAA
jgi:hypothetical protein